MIIYKGRRDCHPRSHRLDTSITPRTLTYESNDIFFPSFPLRKAICTTTIHSFPNGRVYLHLCLVLSSFCYPYITFPVEVFHPILEIVALGFFLRIVDGVWIFVLFFTQRNTQVWAVAWVLIECYHWYVEH